MIVCAALRYPDGTIVVGPRHFDHVMQAQIQRLAVATVFTDASMQNLRKPEQGFIDERGTFYLRETAWIEARCLQQPLINLGKWPAGKLYSENLY